jgi:hypothetical protein
MKWVHAVVAAAFIGIVYASDEVGLTRDVGSGFRMVIKSLPTGPGAFESVAQYHYLFYKDIELGQYDSYSVAPSGKYALLQDAPTGDIVLFASTTAQRRGRYELYSNYALKIQAVAASTDRSEMLTWR